MLPPGRLGFAIRKLYADLLGTPLPDGVPSAEICVLFETALADFDSDLAMCDRSALVQVLTFAEGASPDSTTQAAIDQVQADIELPPAPA